jgi:hypothetical protein
MLTLSPSLLVVVGILTTAVAQILLKKASGFEIRTSSWILWMGLTTQSRSRNQPVIRGEPKNGRFRYSSSI